MLKDIYLFLVALHYLQFESVKSIKILLEKALFKIISVKNGYNLESYSSGNATFWGAELQVAWLLIAARDVELKYKNKYEIQVCPTVIIVV